jgi:hypothetical protein
MEAWKIRSNNRQQLVISLICLIAGAVLVFSLHDYGASGSNRQAGFLLGVVLLALGGATLAAGGAQSVVVDPQQRLIRIEDHRLIGDRQQTIAIADIRDIQVGCLQTRAKHALRYFLQLTLADGQSRTLFAPERDFPGASDPQIVAGWKTRLDRLREHPAASAPPKPAITA